MLRFRCSVLMIENRFKFRSAIGFSSTKRMQSFWSSHGQQLRVSWAGAVPLAVRTVGAVVSFIMYRLFHRARQVFALRCHVAYCHGWSIRLLVAAVQKPILSVSEGAVLVFRRACA